MNLNTALVILVVGALAGLISGLIASAKGRSFGPVVHVIVGIVGAFHGRWLFAFVGVNASAMIGHIIFAGIGALLFLYPLKFIRPS